MKYVIVLVGLLVAIVSHHCRIWAERDLRVTLQEIKNQDAIESDIGKWMDEEVEDFMSVTFRGRR